MQSALVQSDSLTVLPANSLTASDMKDENSRPPSLGAGQQFNFQNPDTLGYLLLCISSQISAGQAS